MLTAVVPVQSQEPPLLPDPRYSRGDKTENQVTLRAAGTQMELRKEHAMGGNGPKW